MCFADELPANVSDIYLLEVDDTGFEPGRPLWYSPFRFNSLRRIKSNGDICMVGWPRGEARDCKSLYTGSNPVSTSIIFRHVISHTTMKESNNECRGWADLLDGQKVCNWFAGGDTWPSRNYRRCILGCIHFIWRWIPNRELQKISHTSIRLQMKSKLPKIHLR